MEFPCQWERLDDQLSLCVTPDHKFGTDAFLLADFAGHRKKDLACDLGTGCGIIPMLWFRQDPPSRVYAVDIQEKAVEQVKRTVEQNGLDGRLFPVRADLRDLGEALPKGAFDLVTCNPPYKRRSTGILSELASEQIARHEVLCTIEDVCQAAARLLKFGGRLCLCQRPERLLDTLEAMRQSGVEPKRLRFVQKREGTEPWLFLAEGKRGAKPYLRVEAPFLIQGDGRDGFSRELLRIYGDGKV